MSNVNDFIEEYKKLEEAVRRVYHLNKGDSIVTELKRHKSFDSYKDSIQSCADLRNFYQHDSKIKNQYIMDVKVEAIDFLKMLTDKVNSRLRCRDICIKFKDVYWRTMDDSVKETMMVMKKNLYTHVPIVDNGKVVGVFDENSLFDFIVNNQYDIFELDDKTTFHDMKDSLSISNRDMEVIDFFSMNKFVDELTYLFEQRFEKGQRLGLVLLTNTGKPTEDLQGILTPWDLVNKG